VVQQQLPLVEAPPAATPLRVLFPRYVAVGMLSVAVDVGSLTILRSGLGVPLLLATTVAFVVALCVNYTLNHVWAFDVDGFVGRRMARYAVLVAINYTVTIAMVTGLTALGVFYLLAKAVSVAVTAAVNFTGYRLWVFR
jgi:putative flippase GtrA